MVKILPITYNYFPYKNEVLERKETVQNNSYQVDVPRSFQCSFGSNFIPRFESVDLSPVLEIGDVTCPACGVKTLSEMKYNILVNEAAKIEEPADLVTFFKNNIDYIPHHMRDTLFKNADLFLQEDNLTIFDYFANSKQNAFDKRYDSFIEIKNFLFDYSKTLEDGELKDSVDKVFKVIDTTGGYQEFKDVFFPLVNRKDFDKDAKDYLILNLFKDLRANSLNFGVYNINDFKTLPSNELSKLWAAKIFSNSLIKQNKIHSYDMGHELTNNSVLECNSCVRKAHPKVFMDFRAVESPEVAKFFLQSYLANIAKLMGEGKIIPNRHYFNNFTFYVNKLSKGSIEFSQADIDRLLSLRALSFKREKFAPIEQSVVDIPCACCGSTLLPHSRRLDIQLKLIQAENLSDYVKILEDNDKYIGVFARDFKEIFTTIYNENPSISQEEFLKEFSARAEDSLQQGVYQALFNFNDGIKYIEKNGTPEQLNLVNLVQNRLTNYISSGFFDDYNYSNLIRSVFFGIDLDSPECTKSVYVLLNDLRTVAYRSSLIMPNDKYNNSDKNPVFTLLFNMFKSDVATGDLLIAAKKGGKTSKDNQVGLCKGCNNLKSNKSVEAWYTQVLSVRKNFRNQLHIIDNMAKEGLLEGYDDWARTIAETMYEATRGRYDLRDEF